jgi:hypothetical protein
VKPALAALFAAALTAAPLGWSEGALVWSVARAGGKAPADGKTDAQALLDQGNHAAGEGDYLTALDRFRAAYARYKSPKLLLNIGAMLRQLGRNVEAATIYDAYLHDPKADPARARDVQRILGEIDEVVARIRVQVNRPGATVRLDGSELTGLDQGAPVLVEPGEHTLVASHPSYPSVVATVRVTRREERVVTLVLVDTPVPAPVRLVQKVTVGIPQRTLGVVTGAIGVAGLALGGVAGTIAAVKNHAAAGHCRNETSCDADGVSLGAVARRSATASTAALSVGGGLLVTGLIVYLTAPGQPAQPNQGAPAAFRFAAAIAGEGPRLRWEGSF